MPIPRPNAPLDPTGIYCLLQALVYRIFSAPLLTNSVGSNTRPKTVTNTVPFFASTLNSQGAGKPATLAPTDPLADWTAGQKALAALTATQSVRVRIEIDSAGVVTYKIGNYGSTLAQALMPRRSSGLATLGWIEISNVAGGFTFGTTSLGSAGVTFFDGDPDLAGIEGPPPSDRGISTDIVSAP